LTRVLEQGLTIVVNVEMSTQPRQDDIGKGPSQPNERTENVLDTTQALEKVTSLHVEALFNFRGELTPSGKKGCSFKKFDEHPFLVFKGNLNPKGAKN